MAHPRTRKLRAAQAAAPPSPSTTPQQALSVPEIRALSNLLERYKFSSRAGVTFNGKRDTYQALGYLTEVTLEHMRQRYERGGVAGRIIEAFPKATWRGGGELIEDDDPEVETKFEKAVGDLETRLSLWSVFLRADTLAGLGQYSTILIGAPGKLDEPLTKVSLDKIAYLSPYAQQETAIQTWDEDINSPRFGLPLTYTFRRRATSATASARVNFERLVHWSRVVHIAENLLDDPVYGQPRLLRVWNLLDDLDKITGGGAEAFWLRAHQGFIAQIDKDAEIDPTELASIRDNLEEFAHQMRRTMGLRGTEVKAMGSDTANIGPNADAVLQQISGATEIPKRILTGSEMGELASTQDTANWNVRVLDRRKEFADPHVVRAFIDRLIGFGALPEADYEVKWPQMENMSEAEKAGVAMQWAGINAQYGGVVVTDAEIRDHCLGLKPLDNPPPPPPGLQPQPQASAPGAPPPEESATTPPAKGTSKAPGKAGDGAQPQQQTQSATPKAARRALAASFDEIDVPLPPTPPRKM